MSFKITRVYSDENGDSHFDEVSYPFVSNSTIGYLTGEVEAKGVIFREVIASYDYDFHTAPQKQFVVLLDGGIEIETSLGEKRSFQQGEVLLLEDVSGKGHRTKNLSPKPRRSLFITLT